ncbi:hypothetical protein [Wolbachia endosymbiont of Tetranychus urticae]
MDLEQLKDLQQELLGMVFLIVAPAIVFPKVNDKGIIKYLSYNGI